MRSCAIPQIAETGTFPGGLGDQNEATELCLRSAGGLKMEATGQPFNPDPEGGFEQGLQSGNSTHEFMSQVQSQVVACLQGREALDAAGCSR